MLSGRLRPERNDIHGVLAPERTCLEVAHDSDILQRMRTEELSPAEGMPLARPPTTPLPSLAPADMRPAVPAEPVRPAAPPPRPSTPEPFEVAAMTPVREQPRTSTRAEHRHAGPGATGPYMLAGALAVATVAFGLTPNEHKAMWMFYLIALGLAGEIGWLFKRLLS